MEMYYNTLRLYLGSGFVAVFLAVSCFLLLNSCENNSGQKFESDIPVSVVPKDKAIVFPFDAGIKIWDVNRIPDRDKTQIEFPHLAFFKGYLYCSFREAPIHGVHIDGRGRVIRSSDGINWESVVLLESATGDIRDPRLSVSTDGILVVNASIAFIEEVAPFQVIDGQTVRRQSVTWLSADGENWTGPYSCPTGINTWRWDIAWHKGSGYSIGYSGKDSGGTLYRTSDGKTWQLVKENLFPGGAGNEAALTFGHEGTLYILLRRGLNAHAALGVSRPPSYQDWNWRELDVCWEGKEVREQLKDITGGADLGGPNLITLKDGRIFGAGKINRQASANYFLLDPEDALLTRVAGVQHGSSYPGIVEHDGDIWLSYDKGEFTFGIGPVYIKRIRLTD